MTEGDLGANWWVERILRPVLVAGMVVCVAAPVVLTLEWVIPGWDGLYLLAFVFLASLEAIYSEWVLQARHIVEWEYLGSRLAELLVLLLLLKLANYIPRGWDQLLAEARAWPTNPGLFFTNLDLATGLLLVPLWAGSIFVGRLTRELDVARDEAEPPEDTTSAAYYLWLTRPSSGPDRQMKLGALTEMFAWGGVAILLASLVLHVVVPGTRVPAAAILLYFALGVTLLSQARFSVTYAGWRAQGIPIQAGLGRRWLLWVAVFLVMVATIVLALPRSYTMGPLEAIWGAYTLLVGGLTYVIGLILFLFSFLLYLLTYLLALLFPTVEPAPRPALPEVPPPAQLPLAEGASPPWLETLLSALFWLVALAILGYALVRFLRDRVSAVDESGESAQTWWGRFLLWLRDLWRQWRAWRQGVQVRLMERRAERAAERSEFPLRTQFLSLRRLPPRELVRYFYLSAARRAAQAGQRRRPGQTPYEYLEDLDRRFPDLEPDLEGLTGAFVAARYSPQPVEAEDADAVKPLWQRIKAALRRRARR